MATNSNERMKILQMLEEGKISAEEATTLLRALGTEQRARPHMGDTGERRYLRVQVTDLTSGSAKVNVTMPMALVSAGLRIAQRFAPEFDDFDMEELEALLASGAEGKIVEVLDEKDNERVEVYVE
jgi:hypothetical protein